MTLRAETKASGGAAPILDIYLAATVACEIEAALLRRVGSVEGGLHDAIEAWRSSGAPRDLVDAAHYVRRERNQVLHHPARPLSDAARFRELSQRLLDHLAGGHDDCRPTERALQLPESVSMVVLHELRRHSDARLAELVEGARERLANLRQTSDRVWAEAGKSAFGR